MFTNYFISKYGCLPKDIKENIRESNYISVMINSALNIYDCPEMEFNTFKLLEIILCDIGFACLGKVGDKICAGFAILDGIDSDGVPICTGGTTIDGKSMSDCFLIRNNTLMTNDMQYAERYAYQLSRIDYAQGKLTEWSTANALPVASTQAMKDGITKALNACGISDVDTVLNKKSWDRGDESQGKDWDLIEFTNVGYSDKFKYLSSYHDDITRRIYFLFGQSSQSPTKQAQTNDSELENRETISKIYVTERLNTRNADLQKFNEFHGTNFTYSFSELWKNNKAIEPMTDNDGGE